MRRRQYIVPLVSGLTALLLLAAGLFSAFRAESLQITTRGVKLSNNHASAQSTYQFFFTGKTTNPIGSIRLQLCANDPFPEEPCTAPVGLNVSGATLTNQTGMTGFSVSGTASTANEIILTRAATPGSTGPSSYTFSSVTNPTDTGTLYVRIMTYSSTDATGTARDSGGIAINIGPSPIAVSTYVPPYILFCVASTISAYDCKTTQGNYIDFGELTTTRTASGQTQAVAATNAKYGFSIAVQGTTMASGTNALNALTVPDVSRQGVSQFGMNLRANTTPSGGQDPQGLGLSAAVAPNYSKPNFFSFKSEDVIVSATSPDVAKYTITYIVNVPKGQAPGYYVSTLTYIALATF